MEKINQVRSLLFVIGVSFFLFSSCGDKEEPIPAGPTMSITTATFTGIPGEVASTTISGTTLGGFNVLRISKTVDGAVDDSFSEEHLRDVAGQQEYSVDFTYTLIEAEVGKEVVFTFLAVDDNSLQSTDVFTVTTDATPIPVTSWTAKLLYAPTGDLTSNTFFSTNTGTIYNVSGVNSTADPVSAEIDFGYFYGVTANASLVDIATYDTFTGLTQVASWGTKNATKFKLTTIVAADFDAIGATDGDILGVHLDNSTNVPVDASVTGLNEGDIISFATDASKTDGSKIGLIKISKLFLGADGTGFASDAYIEIEVKL